MFRPFILFVYSLLGIVLLACSTTPSEIKRPTIAEILDRPDIINFPLQTTAYGRWVVDVNINGSQTASMIVDTGATYSALFEDILDNFQLTHDLETTVRIHGLVASGTTPVSTVKQLGFGQDIYLDKSFAVLPKHDGSTEEILPVDGIIGMDILKGYRIYVDRAESQIYFIPNEAQQARRPIGMREITLYPNPYSEFGANLHFFTMGIRIKDTPALLDTGNDVHIMNWHAANFVEASAMKARLKSRWKLEGAIGEFKPVIRATISMLEANQYVWENVIVVIKDTDSLNILGVEDQPLIVAGISLLDNRNVYIDFENNIMWLEDITGIDTDSARTVSICVSC